MAKSAVSKQLAALEAQLGTRLVRRTTRSQSLTDTGRAYFERCRQILADVEELDASITHQGQALSGQIKLGVPHSFGVHHLAPAINRFLSLHPQIDFDIDFNDRRIDLIREGYDLGIRIGELEDSSLIARKLAPIRHVLCASPDYLRANGTLEHPRDLRRHKVLHYSNLQKTSWRFHDPDGCAGTVKISPRILANSGDFIVSAAAAGHGIALQPSFLAHRALREGALVALLPGYTWIGLSMYAVYPQTRHLSHRIRAFIDFLVDAYDGVPQWERGLPVAPGKGVS